MRYLLVLLWSAVAVADAPTALDPIAHSILWGRFSIQLPEGMRLTPNPTDSIGLTMPRAFAARAALDVPNGRFVMTAMDTLTFVDGDFVSAVKRELATNGVAVAALREVKRRDSRIVVVDPVLPRRATDSNLVQAAYIKGEDRQVVVFGFYILGDARIDAEGWAQIARDAIDTLTDEGGTPVLEIAGSMIAGDHTLSITVPLRWLVFGLSADQHRTEGLLLREKVALGNPGRSCTIDRSLSTAPLRVTTSPSRWLARPAIWRTWQVNSSHQAEIEVKLGDTRVRAWCTAKTVGGLREAQRIVGEMTLH